MPVTFEKRDHIGIVTLSRPPARNAWGQDFNEGLERKRKPVFRGR
jgi:enoyl-CoA hydratase/carnithine racemase